MKRYMKPYKKILFGTDFSRNADAAFEHATDLAAKYNAKLVIAHVINVAPMTAYESYTPVIDFSEFSRSMDDRIQRNYVSRVPASISTETKVISGYPAAELVSFADQEGIDLIVIGAHGETSLAYALFGSVADRVVRKAKCSVLIVRLPSGTPNQE